MSLSLGGVSHQRIQMWPLDLTFFTLSLSLSLSLVLSCMMGPSFLSVSRGMELCQISLSSFKWLYYMASNRIESFQAEHILHQSNPTRRKIFSTLPPIKSCHAAMYSTKGQETKSAVLHVHFLFGCDHQLLGKLKWDGLLDIGGPASIQWSRPDLSSPRRELIRVLNRMVCPALAEPRWVDPL